MINSILWVIGVLAFIWIVYDVWAVNKKLEKNTGIKVVWTILAFIFSIITAIIYYFIYKK